MLLPLREELALLQASMSDGMPHWHIHDPSTGRYTLIGWQEFEMLSRWGLGTPAAVAEAVSSETTLKVTAGDVEDVAQFMLKAELVRATSPLDTQRMAARISGNKHSPAKWLMHNYLFLRLRLFNPDAFLGWCLPIIEWMFTRAFVCVLSVAALVGFFLVSRRWDSFTHSLVELFTPEGALLVACALSVSKVVHELGHGFAAKRLGCNVPAMGVAFLVLWPVLWTDTTDAWKLTDKRDRLLIDGAGMLAEISLATLATLLWSVMDDGALRSAAFILASSTWLLTLAVNLNPLMRFDGYYILSDLAEIPNLQERGFAQGKWWLRKVLLGNKLAQPEPLSGQRLGIMLCWCFATWFYRFGLFLGIALLVYHISFKALGFVLLAVELHYFLVGPIVKEIWSMTKIAARTPMNLRLALTITTLCAGMMALTLPWRTHVSTSGVLRAAHQSTVFSAERGMISTVSATGRNVQAGDVLFIMSSIDIAHDIAVSHARLQGIAASRQGQAFDPDRRGSLVSAAEDEARVSAELATSMVREASLTIRAPFAGRLLDVPETVREGLYVPRREPLGVLVDTSGAIVEAYVQEVDVGRMREGANAWFVPEGGGEATALTLRQLDTVSARSVDVPELASTDGGPLPVRKDPVPGHARLAPEGAVYRAVLVPSDNRTAPVVRIRGHVSIEAARESILSRTWRRVTSVVMREAGL